MNQALYLVPRFFQNKPTSHLISPRVAPEQLNGDALGRALDTLYDFGVTELYSLMAATAAKRLGLGPPYAHLDTTSFHVNGRSNHDEPPSEHVVPITRGYSRDHRPDLNQVMLELIVEHQAGIPVLIQPLSGNSSDAKGFGRSVSAHIGQLQATYGPTYLVADSALYSEENRGTLQDTHTKWITRVPATLREAQEALAQANPETMRPLQAGYRYHPLSSTYAGGEQRWLLIYSEPRRLQAGRTVNKRWLKHSEKEANAFKKLCRTDFACEADAQQAVRTFAHGLTCIALHAVAIRPIPHYAKAGRPQPDTVPTEGTYRIVGAMASPLAAHEARMSQESCWIVATHELDETALPPLACVEA